jgi:transglutaminase-like putative cysteine protease
MSDPKATPWAQRIAIPTGARGTTRTLEIGAPLAAGALQDPLYPPFVRRKILVETGTDPRDFAAVAANVYRYIQANVGYQPDPLVFGADEDASIADYVQSPHWTLFVEGFGDCLAHALVAASFAMSLGHGARLRTLRADPLDPSRFSHVYAVLGFAAPSGPLWVPVDTTVPDGEAGLEFPHLEQYRPQDFLIAEAS